MRVSELIESVAGRERPLRLLRVRGTAGAFLVAHLRAEHKGPLLVISPSSKAAETFDGALRAFSPETDTTIFRRHDTPPYDRFSPHPEIENRRMSLLYSLLSAGGDTPLTLIAPWTALMRRVPSRSELRGRITHLECGLTLDRDALLEVLVSAGYHRASLVEERGEVAARGGILDLFPPHFDKPVRIEFDFDQIGSIRQFDSATQRSESELRSFVAIPPRSYRLPNNLDDLVRRVREMGRDARIPESNIYSLTEALARRHLPTGIENLEALFHDHMETVFDYLPESTLIVMDDPEAIATRAQAYTEEIFQGHSHAQALDQLVCDPLSLFIADDTAFDLVRARRPVLLDRLGVRDLAANEEIADLQAKDHRVLRQEIQDNRGSGRALQPLADQLERWQTEGRRVRITCPSLSAAERLADILADYNRDLPIARTGGEERSGEWTDWPEPGAVDIALAKLEDGFELPDENLVLLTEQNIFGTRLQSRRPVRRTREGQSIDRLAQIQQGDFLVHAEHGIGLYGGLLQLNAGGVRQEFLLLEYGQGDKLYIPVSRLGQIQRFASADGSTPSLDKLGGQVWTRTKARVRKAIRDMADALLAVIAARKVLRGFAFPPPDPSYEEFEARFPYEDTPDQNRASQDVLEDMQREQPMDRLVCGDVGFGKTEIACRAAFVATAAGKQVAFLVPTTVLCQQHLETLKERFAETPVQVASLSRLSSTKEARAVREGLAAGQIDIVVGTHRLLSKDISFRNLGLVVVDEEHRFGVAHKERLKQMRKLIDVLTLSATPIPRTLQMAFSGMRELSVIATPPPERLAVRTQVCRFGDEIIRESIERELRRGGQVFFVHNRIETIAEMGHFLRNLMPDIRIAIAHGQMHAQKLEEVMLAFMKRDYDVLLCTAIIESGLDIPNANTILINRADMFGMAQLYQLRGRVGRSDRRAYAYLFLPPGGGISEDALRRLEAIQDLSELGAGFRLATEDLEIRGAGNMLGGEQSGNIASVGYDLYMQMLEEAIARLQGEGIEEFIEPEIRLPVPALLPEDYIPDVSQRLVLYKRLSSARNVEDLDDVRSDLLDRFGALPSEAQCLCEVIRLKVRCRTLGIESAEVKNGELVMRVAEQARIDPRQLVRFIERPGTPIRVTPERQICLALRRSDDSLAEAFGLLDLIAPEKNEDGTAGETGAAKEEAR
ncbi:MAG: transcription-repair coupling factor [bacterium]|nr:transcription-repair coupling factor [bacterium]